MELIVLAVMVCSILGSFLADRRGGSPLTGAALGLFLGPLGVVIAAVMGGKVCPACRSRMHVQATTCPRCREALA
jgi:hypothetical protein